MTATADTPPRTPLDNWLRLAPDYCVQALADESQTTVSYLKILAKGTKRDPALSLALRVAENCEKYRRVCAEKHSIELPEVAVASLVKRDGY